MNTFPSQIEYPLSFRQWGNADAQKVVLLLHGFGESSFQMEKRFENFDKEILFIAPDGIFPLIKEFPLKKTNPNRPLLRHFAWYFFDASTGEYPLDFSPSVSCLKHFLLEKFKNRDLYTVGYSQGGYLSLFLHQALPLIKGNIGVNCSWRCDLITDPAGLKNAKFVSINGDCDAIVDPNLAQSRFEDLVHLGVDGNFLVVKGSTHAWDSQLSTECYRQLEMLLN